ncbi:MAG: hypothetical protein K2N44_10345 [Lachnospiraceae bacterium]|nr:hypothetical protein [Lachnospiraceae bacterium]
MDNVVGVNMVLQNNKRKIEYEGTCYYWYVRVNDYGHRVYIVSEDKKVHLEYPFLDTEIPVTPQEIRKHLKEYYIDVLQGEPLKEKIYKRD